MLNEQEPMEQQTLQPTNPMTEPNVRAENRTPEGLQLHDGAIAPLAGCPRGRTDCLPIARRASPGYESFICSGETSGAPVPTDTTRLCVKSTHDRSPVDLLVNLDERDTTDALVVLSSALAWHTLREER
jgi:hypothetical protein